MVGCYWLLNVSPLGLVLCFLVRSVPNRIVLVMNILMMSFLLYAGSAWSGAGGSASAWPRGRRGPTLFKTLDVSGRH